MIRGSPAIALTLAVQMSGLLAYNVAGMAVTGHLGAVFRTVLETSRTLAVWVVDLILAATGAGGGKLGESWGPWSWVQAGGFAVLVAGTLLYGQGDEVDRAAAGGWDAGAEEGLLAGSVGGTSDGTATPTLFPAVPGRAAAAAAMPVRRRHSTASSSLAASHGGPSLGATPMSFRSTMALNAVSSYGGPPAGSAFGGLAGGTGHGSGAVASFLAGRGGGGGEGGSTPGAGGSSDGA